MSDAGRGKPLVVAIDQGTSSTKALVLDGHGRVVSRASVPVAQAHPQPGWVEQEALEILKSVKDAVHDALATVDGDVVAVGLSSQRESAVAWHRLTGEPLSPVLGWQDRRTAGEAQELVAGGHEARVRDLTGLPIDPMFSALKFRWILDHVDPDRSRSAQGEICLGTVDSWLVFALTGEHRIETGNASRTLLLNIDTGDWDAELLDLFEIPRAALPEVTGSTRKTKDLRGLPAVGPGVAITAVLADSHAALFGHGVRAPGSVKATFGTGSSIMGLLPAGGAVGEGLVRTVAWSFDAPVHAFEGNILSAGSTAVWCAGVLGSSPARLAELAETVDTTNGVYLVPAFAGLGAPWWDDEARGLIAGLTLGTSAAHLARAAFESIAFQVEDVLTAASQAGSQPLTEIFADGGPAANGWLMQLQADISQREVLVPTDSDLSAIGVAHLAGRECGLWTDDAITGFATGWARYAPSISPDEAARLRAGWHRAVDRARLADHT